MHSVQRAWYAYTCTWQTFRAHRHDWIWLRVLMPQNDENMLFRISIFHEGPQQHTRSANRIWYAITKACHYTSLLSNANSIHRAKAPRFKKRHVFLLFGPKQDKCQFFDTTKYVHTLISKVAPYKIIATSSQDLHYYMLYYSYSRFGRHGLRTPLHLHQSLNVRDRAPQKTPTTNIYEIWTSSTAA